MRKQLISSSSSNVNPTLNTNSATPVHEGKRTHLIYPVDEGHRSQQTAAKYKKNFQHFLDYIRIRDLDVFLDLGREAIQELVMKYTLSLRDNAEKKYTRGTVNNMIAPIIYFLSNNDIELNKRKVRRYFPQTIRKNRTRKCDF